MEVSCGLNLAYTAVLTTPTDGRTCRGQGSAGTDVVFGNDFHFLQG